MLYACHCSASWCLSLNVLVRQACILALRVHLDGGYDGCQGPGIIKAVFGSFRGYAGNISAAGALDAVSNDGNTLIIDIRCFLTLCCQHSNCASLCTSQR